MVVEHVKLALSDEQRIAFQVAYNEWNAREDDTSPAERRDFEEYVRANSAALRQLGDEILTDDQKEQLQRMRNEENVVIQLSNIPTLNPMPPIPSSERERHRQITRYDPPGQPGVHPIQPSDFATTAIMCSLDIELRDGINFAISDISKDRGHDRLGFHRDYVSYRGLNIKVGNSDAATEFVDAGTFNIDHLEAQGVLDEAMVEQLRKKVFKARRKASEFMHEPEGLIDSSNGMIKLTLLAEEDVHVVGEDATAQAALDTLKAAYEEEVLRVVGETGDVIMWSNDIGIKHARSKYDGPRWATTISGGNPRER